jgi:hypothetical protein
MHTDRHLEDVNRNESNETTAKKPYHAPQLKALGEIHGLVQKTGSDSDGDAENYSHS